MKHYNIAVLAFAALITALVSCSSNPLEFIPDDSKDTPGRRDYFWTADTFKIPFCYIDNIWGDSPDNIYLICNGSDGGLLHYDGSQWSRAVYMMDPLAAWGTNGSFWTVASYGQIWRYGNGVFTVSPEYKLNNKPILFITIAGKDYTEIYAGGGTGDFLARDGILYRYNGVDWGLEKVFKNIGNIFLLRYLPTTDKYYFATYLANSAGNDSTYFCEYDRKNIKVLYSGTMDRTNYKVFNTIDKYLYVVAGNTINRYYNEKKNFLFEVNDPNFGGAINGRNSKDIFIRMYDGLAHYNGTDWKYILKLKSECYIPGNFLVLEKDIYYLTRDYSTGYNIIYHGKLN